MPEWTWPFSRSIQLFVELFLSPNTLPGINLKNIEKRQLWIRPMGVILIKKIYWKTSAVSTTCLNGWNSILQAAWYIRHVRMIWFLWTKRTIWLLILSCTQNIVRACSMFYHEGYRSVTPLDAARVNRTIFHNHFVHWCYITFIKGKNYKGASRRAALASRRFARRLHAMSSAVVVFAI